MTIWPRLVGWTMGAGLAVGAVGGLVLGLIANPPTAPFAVVEGAAIVGFPATVLALVAGGLVAVVEQFRRRRR